MQGGERMRKKILTLCVSIITILLIFATTAYAAGGGFDSGGGSGGSAGKAEDDQWAISPHTGTRYVVRVNGKDIGDTTEGGLGKQKYYINHFYNAVKLDQYNPTEEDERKLMGTGKKNSIGEAVYVGNIYEKDVWWPGTGKNSKRYKDSAKLMFKENQFFDTPACSLANYQKETNDGKSQYRHVIIWARPFRKRRSDSFGLITLA